MRKLAWIVDSTCGYALELEKQNNIYVLPMLLDLDGVTYHENIDITDTEFYAKLPHLNTPPTTSQPKLHDVVKLFEELKEKEYEVIALTLSSKLSGTYSTFQMAKHMTGLDVHVIDGYSGAYVSWKILEHGMELAQKGLPTEEIVKSMESIKLFNDHFIFPKDLNQLARSGRVTGMQNFIASLLRITPVLSFHDGVVESVDKVRSPKAAKKWVIDKIKERMQTHSIKEIGISHAFDPEAANDWKEAIEEKFPNVKIAMDRFTMAVSVHNGQGTVSVSWMYE